MSARFGALLPLTTVLAIGCGELSAAQSKLLVEVKERAVTATRSSAGNSLWGSFTVDVTLRNTTASTIQVYGCAPSLEREISSERWVIALEPVCSLVGPPLELTPMSQRSEKVQRAGGLNDNAEPQFRDHVLAGRYRLLYRYAAAGVKGPVEEARSGAFDVTE